MTCPQSHSRTWFRCFDSRSYFSLLYHAAFQEGKVYSMRQHMAGPLACSEGGGGRPGQGHLCRLAAVLSGKASWGMVGLSCFLKGGWWISKEGVRRRCPDRGKSVSGRCGMRRLEETCLGFRTPLENSVEKGWMNGWYRWPSFWNLERESVCL